MDRLFGDLNKAVSCCDAIIFQHVSSYAGRAFFVHHKQTEKIMETRVALIGIIVEEPASVAPLNELLHEYRQYIIGRMGIPYKPRNISVISVTLDAPQDVISSLSGKLGMLKGVTSKALMAKLS